MKLARGHGEEAEGGRSARQSTAGWWRSGNDATTSSRATGLDASRRAKPARSGSSRAASWWRGLTGPGEGRRSAMAEGAEEGAKQRRRLGRWREQQGSAMEGHGWPGGRRGLEEDEGRGDRAGGDGRGTDGE